MNKRKIKQSHVMLIRRERKTIIAEKEKTHKKSSKHRHKSVRSVQGYTFYILKKIYNKIKRNVCSSFVPASSFVCVCCVHLHIIYCVPTSTLGIIFFCEWHTNGPTHPSLKS